MLFLSKDIIQLIQQYQIKYIQSHHQAINYLSLNIFLNEQTLLIIKLKLY